ncbi:MAG: hypothetical protein HY906_03680 [Deltaproteobacteria bacterium]|nr:hypothetical protein [Deltaproteobacteria bacterium]
MVRRVLSAALGMVGLLAPAPASGQAAAERPASADALSAEGRRLTGQHRFAEAELARAGVASASQPADERVAKRPAPRAMSRRRLAAWITTGVAAAALVAAASCTGYALSRAADVDALYDQRYSSGQPVRYSAVAQAFSAGRRDLDRTNYAIFATHLTWVLAAAVSIYLWVTSRARIEKRVPSRAQLHLLPAVLPGGAALGPGPEY